MFLFSKTPTIAPKDAAQEMLKDSAILVDVRTLSEYEGGHAKGSIHIPLGELEERIGEVKGMGEVYLICQTGGRSAQATNMLIAKGMNAINVSGGTRAWRSEGLSME